MRVLQRHIGLPVDMCVFARQSRHACIVLCDFPDGRESQSQIGMAAVSCCSEFGYETDKTITHLLSLAPQPTAIKTDHNSP